MKSNWIIAFTVLAAAVGNGAALAQVPAAAITMTPDELKWNEAPNGTRVATIKGDQKLAGQVVFRAKWPAGFRIAAHNHPDERVVTVLAGTYYFGQGEKFDESRLKAFPAGSVIIVPPRVSHFATTLEGAEFQEMGTGPTQTDFAGAAEAQKKQ